MSGNEQTTNNHNDNIVVGPFLVKSVNKARLDVNIS